MPADEAYPDSFNLGGFTSHLPISWGAPSSFPNLETLSLFGYNLIGTLPDNWGCSSCFPKLRILQLAGSTNLTGTLPTTWSSPGSCPQLIVLNLAVAALNSSIPAAWVSANAFPSLTYLSFANTTLTGPIPSFNNSQLAVLDLSFSTLSGNISDLWSSNATTISAIGLTSVNISGSFPEWFPQFWSSLQILIVDNTSINGTIPTSWLKLTDVTSTGAYSQMQHVTFSGASLWSQSVNDTAWWQDICSSFSKTVGYVYTTNNEYTWLQDMSSSLSQTFGFLSMPINLSPSQTYLDIQPLSSSSLDVTAFYGEGLPLLPNNAPTSVAHLNYYTELQDPPEWANNDFGIQGLYARGDSEIGLPAPPCHRPSRVIPVVATWSVFGALLLALIAGYVIWRLMSKGVAAFLAQLLAFPEPILRFSRFCWTLVPLLGLALYLYDLISDMEVAQTVWGLQNWYGKVVVAIILGHYAVRATVVTFHVSRYMGQGCLHSPLQIGLMLLCIPLVVVMMPVLDVLCSLEFLHISFGPIDVHGYRSLRALVMPILQSLPNVIVTTVIYYQGAAPFALGSFEVLGVLKYNSNPQFLTKFLYLQDAITSFGSILWGFAEWFHLSHQGKCGLLRSFVKVMSGDALCKGVVKVNLLCSRADKVRVDLRIV